MNLLKLAWASLLSRKTNAFLTIAAIAISVMLLLGVERVSQQTRAGFANTISGTDLIVGARSGPTNLLLFSVFHIGYPASTVSWESYQHWRDHEQVRWSIPIALGDSFRGHPVIGTDLNFFEHFQYGQRQHIELAEGHTFEHTHQAVLGAQVARRHQLAVGDDVIVAHGTGSVSFHHHDEEPLQISGILSPTGTPVDHAVYVPLTALALMHGENGHGEHEHHDEEPARPDFSHGAPAAEPESHAHAHSDENTHQHISIDHAHPVDSLSAFFVGLHSQPRAIFMQRMINTWRQEPLTSIMPGATLQELWRSLNAFERTLAIISGFVLLTGLIGMLATLLASLQERRREMAVLRSLGAGPGRIFTLLVSEAMALTLIGIASGIALLYAVMAILAPWIHASFGIIITLGAPSAVEWQRMGIVLLAAFIVSCIPAWRAYRLALTDGLTIKL